MGRIKETVMFKIDKTKPHAKMPKANRKGDVGYDIVAAEDVTIPPGEIRKVPTGVYLANMPLTLQGASAFIKIEGRSGMALDGVFPVGGIIDPTYRGEIMGVLFNSSKEPYEIKAGDRIAQMLLYSVYTADDVKFVETNKISETNRGDKGFGSSGKR